MDFPDVSEPPAPVFAARDRRIAAKHPLRHVIIDVIRQVADWRASLANEMLPSLAGQQEDEVIQNGTSYLLTNQVMFTSHEPCIMCSMALLHSRVKEVHYLIPMLKTGGCGGAACLPALPGVNHRFRIYSWNATMFKEVERLMVDGGTDA